MILTVNQIQEIIREVIDEIKIEEKKKRKPQCIKGNAVHMDDGRFGKATDGKGSWSIGRGNKSGQDCDWGQMARPNANRTTRWVKRPCGRAGKYRCKDGTVKEYEYTEDTSDSIQRLDSDGLHGMDSDVLVDELVKRIEEGGMNAERILRVCSAINQSAKGEYPKRK